MKARPATCRSNDARDSTMRQSGRLVCCDELPKLDYGRRRPRLRSLAAAIPGNHRYAGALSGTTENRRRKVASSARRRLSGLSYSHQCGTVMAPAPPRRVIVLDRMRRARGGMLGCASATATRELATQTASSRSRADSHCCARRSNDALPRTGALADAAMRALRNLRRRRLRR